jgi:hypothetical protein
MRFGALSMNVWAAASAAASRDGLTSFAAMEPETSMTSTTVARSLATSVERCGRAIATQIADSASRKSASGTQRRQSRPPATEASTSRFV